MFAKLGTEESKLHGASFVFVLLGVEASWCGIVCPFQGLPWLRICCNQHFSQMEKLVQNEINFTESSINKLFYI